jgi:hypothetical protein
MITNSGAFCFATAGTVAEFSVFEIEAPGCRLLIVTLSL